MTALKEALNGLQPHEIGKRLFVHSMSGELEVPGDGSAIAADDAAHEAEEENWSDNEEDGADDPEPSVQRRTGRRRLSISGTALTSISPSRNVVDMRFIVCPAYELPSFDCKVYRLDKDLYFIHESVLCPPIVFARVSKSSKGLLSGSSWQIFAGKDEPVAVIKQNNRASTLNSTYGLYVGSDASRGFCMYTLLKKLRSSKLRVYNGDGSKEHSMLNCFCLISPERVYIKLQDGKSLGEALGGTIVDWRQHNNVMRVGKGFDFLLAVACFCLADAFESLCSTPVSGILAEVSDKVKHSTVIDFRKTLGW